METATEVVVADGATVSGKNAQLAVGSHITGTVAGAQGAALSSVFVTAYQRAPGASYWNQVGNASTDTDGDYDLAGLRAGTYRLQFSPESSNHLGEYWDNAQTLETATDIAVGAGETVSGKNAQLAAGSQISGTVTDISGAGAQSVLVTAYQRAPGAFNWSTVDNVTANASGGYELDGLRAGTYRIGFSDYAGTYAPEYFDDVETVESATDIVVAAGATVAGMDAQLADSSHITGTLTTADGAGVSNVSVSVYRKQPGTNYWFGFANTSTDSSGGYDLDGLRAGTYRIGFSTWSGGYLSEFWDNASTLETAADIAVGAGETVSGRNAQLATASNVTGAVTGPDGTGLSNVSVSAYQKAAGSTFWNQTVMSASTNSDGDYDLGGLKAGTYRIGFSTWSGGHLSEFWDNATTVDAASDIVVGESATVAGKNAQLATASHITGKVTGPDGTGLSNVYVSAYQKTAGSTFWNQTGMSASTNSEGDYDLGGLKAGTYRIAFDSYAGGFLREFWDNAMTVDAASDIVVGESATVAGKNAQLATASHITGKVTGPGGTGLSNVSVSAYQKAPGSSLWNQTGMPASTNSDGDYDLGGLKVGTYRIGFSTWSGEHLSEFWDNATTVDTASDVVVGESTTVSGKNAQLATASHITGKVTGPDGTGLSGVSVSAYQKPAGANYWSSMAMSASTTSTGDYDLGGLKPGSYRIGFTTYAGGFLQEFWDNATTVDTASDIVVGESATVPGRTPSWRRRRTSRAR